MPLTKSKYFSFRVSYSPNVTQIKLFFKFNKFAIDLFFRVGLPLHDSRDASKKKLKSLAKTICLSYKSLIIILSRSWRVATCSVSVLGLYILTRTKLNSSILTSNIKLRPFLSVFCPRRRLYYFLHIYLLLHKSSVYHVKKIGPFNLSVHFFPSAKDEWVSYKSKNPLEPKLFFKYSNILILLKEFCSPLTLFDIKCNFTPITY